MTPFVSDPDLTMYVGDCLDVLRTLPDGCVDACVTSPPFYALRDYGVDGQIGLEATPEEWAARLVGVFSEARRVLSDTGSLWVECGDSYVSGQGGRQSAVGELPATTRFDRKEAGEARPGLPSSFGERDVGPRFYPTRDTGLKPKDLLGQPFLLAFALRADGYATSRTSRGYHKLRRSTVARENHHADRTADAQRTSSRATTLCSTATETAGRTSSATPEASGRYRRSRIPAPTSRRSRRSCRAAAFWRAARSGCAGRAGRRANG